MKLCMISLGDMHDPRTWSGTVQAVTQRFEDHGLRVEGLNIYKKLRHAFIGAIRRVYQRFFFEPYNFRDGEFGQYALNSKRLRRYLAPYHVDAYFFMGEYCLNKRFDEKAKYYAYIDRIRRPLIEITGTTKPGMQEYLKRYEKNDIDSLSHLDKIFTMNEWSKKLITDYYHIPEHKVIDVGVGVNVDFLEEEKDYSSSSMLIVLRKGTEHYKGLDLLLDAFQIAKEKIPDLTLNVVGTQYKEVEGVRYFFNQPRSVTIKLFKECTIYAMPALSEPNGTTYLEALANKSPTIGLNRFAYPEFCGYGEYGFIAKGDTPQDVAEAICEAFSDRLRLRRMGEAGQRYVKNKYRWDAVVSKMLACMYEQ